MKYECKQLFSQFQKNLEIYRIVSNKALESSTNEIKPTAGETISVSQQPDEPKQGGCC